jgi:Opioid growth factor receptor (OGFr) conserved region
MILDFYRGEPLPNGRCLVDIWDWSFDQLEHMHDYIQWMFPLNTPSAANPDAPLLSEETTRAFEWDDVLRDRLQKSLAVMLRFYGLERLVLPDGKIIVIRAVTFSERRGVWLRPNNHNHLRLTRIIRSLRLLGLKKDARALAKCLGDITRVEGRDLISEETAEHWRRAARR